MDLPIDDVELATVVTQLWKSRSDKQCGDVYEKLKLVKSRSEVKRLIKSKGIKIDNENYNRSDFSLSKYFSKKEIKISVGKKNFGIIKIYKK